MLNFHNPYAEDADEAAIQPLVPEPSGQPEVLQDDFGEGDVESRIRANFLKIKQSRHPQVETNPYTKPEEARIDALMSGRRAFFEALMRIELAVEHNGERAEGAAGEDGHIHAEPGSAGGPAGAIRVKDRAFANWLLEQYEVDLQIVAGGQTVTDETRQDPDM